MKKVLKLFLIAVLVVATALTMVACNDGGGNKDAKTGLLYKKNSDGTWVIYDYKDEGKGLTTLDIGAVLDLPEENAKVRIKKNAFSGNDTLKEIIVSEEVTEIDAGAFANMKALEVLNVPFVGKLANANVYENSSASAPAEEKAVDSERTIAHFFGTEAYDDGCAVTVNYGASTVTCYMPLTLHTVIVSTTKEYGIPMFAFNGAVNLNAIQLNGNINAIGKSAFENTAFESITLPATIKNIYEKAFKGARIKTVNLTASENKIVVGASAFEGCNLLDKVNSNNAKTVDLSKFSAVGTNAFKTGNKTAYTVVNPLNLDLDMIFDNYKK